MEQQQRPGPKTNKSLMRLEHPIQPPRPHQQSEAEWMIQQLLSSKTQKPKIEPIQRSPIFAQLEAMMPKFRQADQELRAKPVPEADKIDLKLEQVEDSDSEDSQAEQEGRGEEKVEDRGEGQEMEQQAESEPTNEIELNFVRYDMPAKLEPPTNETISEQNGQKQKKKLVEQM